MAITTNTDLHNIHQLGTNAVDVAFAATPLLSIPGLAVNVSDRIADAGGNIIDFTVWDTDVAAIAQNAVRNSRTGVTPSKLSLTSYSETAIAKTISIDGDRYAFGDSSEDVADHLANVVGKEFSRIVQANMISQAVDLTDGTDLVHDISADTTKTMNVNAILQARLQWGEKASEIGSPYLFMKTSQYADLAQDSDFKTMAAGGSASPVLAPGDWNKYVVATVHGVNIVLLDSLPVSEDVTPEITALMVGEGAFGLYVANEPETVEINWPGSSVKTIDTHFRFATTMFRHSPRRVVKLITT